MGVTPGAKRGRYKKINGKSNPGEGIGVAVKRMVLRVCPVTAGNPTRLSMATWERMCAHHLKRARARKIPSAVDKDMLSKFCRKCKGKMMPKELEIIDKEVMPDGKA